MADKTQQAKDVETTVEEVEKTKPEEKTKADEKTVEEEPAKVENGDAENGDSKEEEDESKEDEKKEKNGEPEKDVCSVKRKSTGGGDATDSKPEEGATPEKKAKLDEGAKVVA